MLVQCLQQADMRQCAPCKLGHNIYKSLLPHPSRAKSVVTHSLSILIRNSAVMVASQTSRLIHGFLAAVLMPSTPDGCDQHQSRRNLDSALCSVPALSYIKDTNGSVKEQVDLLTADNPHFEVCHGHLDFLVSSFWRTKIEASVEPERLPRRCC